MTVAARLFHPENSRLRALSENAMIDTKSTKSNRTRNIKEAKLSEAKDRDAIAAGNLPLEHWNRYPGRSVMNKPEVKKDLASIRKSVAQIDQNP